MDIETFLLSPSVPGETALVMSAKRYRPASQPPSDGVTLLMFHGMGQHKEQWEPVVEKLFAQAPEKPAPTSIREVWAFDWQNHGESAVENEQALKEGPKVARLDHWAAAVAAFIRSDFVKGHRLVGVGHSAGTVALLLSTQNFVKCPYLGIILVEPSMTDEDILKTHREEIQSAFDMVTKAVIHRRDGWATKKAAQKYFLARFPWNSWDPRIVALFVEHGLRDSKDKDGNPCVVRKCPMIHEASAFQANLEVTWVAADQLAKLSGQVPIHVVFGENVDLMTKVIRDCVVDKAKGRKVDSITLVPDAGHTV
ncbi:alpha/beta-hydrolase, partial [Mycena filopes]